MPRIQFPDGQVVEFPDDIEEAEVRRLSKRFWNERGTDRVPTQIEPPSQEMRGLPPEAPQRPSDRSEASPASIPSPLPQSPREERRAAPTPLVASSGNPGMGDLYSSNVEPESKVASEGPAGEKNWIDKGLEWMRGQEWHQNLKAGEQVQDWQDPQRTRAAGPSIGAEPMSPQEKVLAQVEGAFGSGFLHLGELGTRIIQMIRAGGDPALKQILEEQGPEAALAAYKQQYQEPVTRTYDDAQSGMEHALGQPAGLQVDDETKRQNAFLWSTAKLGNFAAEMLPFMMLGPTMPAHQMARSKATQIAQAVAAGQMPAAEGKAALHALTQSMAPILADAGAFGAVEGVGELAKTGDPVQAAATGAGTAAGVAALGLGGKALRGVKGAMKGESSFHPGKRTRNSKLVWKQVAAEMHPDRAGSPADKAIREEFFKSYGEAAQKGDWKAADRLDAEWAKYQQGVEFTLEETKAQVSTKRLPEETYEGGLERREAERRTGEDRRQDLIDAETRQKWANQDRRIKGQERRRAQRRIADPEMEQYYDEHAEGTQKAKDLQKEGKIPSDKELLDQKPAVDVEAVEPKPVEPKVGDMISVQDTPSRLERIHLDDQGVRHELYIGEDGKGFIRGYDAEANQVIAHRAFPSFKQARTTFEESFGAEAPQKVPQGELFARDVDMYQRNAPEFEIVTPEFAERNIPRLYDRIGEVSRIMYDSDALGESEFWPPDTPIPEAGGLLAARKTSKYFTDPIYQRYVDTAISEATKTVQLAHDQAQILQGAHPKGKVSLQAEGVEVGYSAGDPDVAWRAEAQTKYKEVGPRRLGNIGAREAFQNALDALLMNKGEGNITITMTGGWGMHKGYVVEDDGVGMTDVDIRDVFLKLHSTGKQNTEAIGRFGTGKAVALVPHLEAQWKLWTQDNYVDSDITKARGRVQKVDPRQGTKLVVESPEYIADRDVQGFIESSEYPSGINVSFARSSDSGLSDKRAVDLSKDPFGRKKHTTHEKIFEGEDKETGEPYKHTVTLKYYPKGVITDAYDYAEMMVLRMHNERSGVKLTQNISGIFDQGFKGTIVVDVTTNTDPSMISYPFDNARLRIEGDMSEHIREFISGKAQEGLSAQRDVVTSNNKPITSWKEWRDTLDKLEADESWKALNDEINAIFEETEGFFTHKYVDLDNVPDFANQRIVAGTNALSEAREKFYDELTEDQKGPDGPINDVPLSFQERPFTPFEEMVAKIDVGYKGPKASPLIAKHLRVYEALARMMAGKVPVNMVQFYPLYSKLENGVRVNSEYSMLGVLGFNPYSLSKSALRSVWAYSKYMESLLDHEFTHYFIQNHNEHFTSTLPMVQDRTADLRPLIERLAYHVVGENAQQEFESDIGRNFPQLAAEKTKTRIITETETVEVPTFLNPEEEAYLYENGKRGIGGAEDRLYLPRPKGQPWQLGIFDSEFRPTRPDDGRVERGPDSGAGDEVSVDVGRGPELPDRGGDGGAGPGGVADGGEYTLTDTVIEAGGAALRTDDGIFIRFKPGSPPSKELKAELRSQGIVWNRRARAYEVGENTALFNDLEASDVVVKVFEKKSPVSEREYGLHQMILDQGGINTSSGKGLSEELWGDRGREGIPLKFRTKDGGITYDEAIELAREQGFLGPDDGVSELVEALKGKSPERVLEDELEGFYSEEGPSDEDLREMSDKGEIEDPPFSVERVDEKGRPVGLHRTEKQADPTENVEVERKAERGFAGKEPKPVTIEKKSLTMEKVRGGDEEVEAFFGRTGKWQTTKKTLRNHIDKMKANMIERFRYLHLLDPKEHPWARERLRHTQEAPIIAARKAVKSVKEYIEAVDSLAADTPDAAGVELLGRKLFLEDMKVEAERAELEANEYHDQNPDAPEAELDELRNRRTPLTKAQILTELARIDPMVEGTPSVKAAYEARQKLWKDVSMDLADRGVIPERAAKNPHYIRHFVLEHIAEEVTGRKVGGAGKKLTEPVRKYAKRRKGTKKDWSSDLLEVEVRALSEIYRDNIIQDIGEEVGEHYDEGPKLSKEAKRNNYVKVVGGEANMRRLEQLRGQKAEILAMSEDGKGKGLDSGERAQLKIINEGIWDLDPTMPMRVKIAVGIQQVSKLLGLEDGGYFEDAWGEDGGYGDIVGRLNELMNDENPDVRIWTAYIIKGINERRVFIQKTLGKDFETVASLAEERGLVPWQFKRGNIVYRAKTLTDRQVAQFMELAIREYGDQMQDKMLIPVDALKDALITGGPHKQYWIPPEVAEQLDDLPIMHKPRLDSGLRRLFLLWKGWILRINPIRYNVRNFIGDFESAFHARGPGFVKRVPEAIKMLTQEGEAQNRLREEGVIGSSLQYEFGELRESEEFKMLREAETIDDVKSAARYISSLARQALQMPQKATQFREDILRLAVHLDAQDRIAKGDYSHKGGRISGRGDVEAIAKDGDAHMAASKVSRETLGDYGSFTPWENEKLRQGWVLFYSWLRINTQRWPRIMTNTYQEASSGAAGWKGAAKGGLAAGSQLTRIMAPYAALWLWNHRDDEAQKLEKATIANQPWLLGKPHITLPDGSVIYTPSAISDFVEWFDIEGSAAILRRYERGEANLGQTFRDILLANATEPVNKVYQAMNPFMKVAVRLTGMQTFPDVFAPRPMYDAWKYKAFEEAFLDVLGPEVKRTVRAAKGDITLKDALAYYFSGSAYRPMTPEKLTERLLISFAWSSLKERSSTTKRKRYEPKKGREEGWNRAVEGLKALGYTDAEIRQKIAKYWREQEIEKRKKKMEERRNAKR